MVSGDHRCPTRSSRRRRRSSRGRLGRGRRSGGGGRSWRSRGSCGSRRLSRGCGRCGGRGCCSSAAASNQNRNQDQNKRNRQPEIFFHLFLHNKLLTNIMSKGETRLLISPKIIIPFIAIFTSVNNSTTQSVLYSNVCSTSSLNAHLERGAPPSPSLQTLKEEEWLITSKR